MWKIVVGTLTLLALGIVGAMALAGWFDQPVFMEKPSGPYRLVYQKMEGEYQQANAQAEDLAEWLKGKGVISTKGFAFYFDHPLEAERGRLRFLTGRIIEEADAAQLPDLGETYLTKVFPRQVCLKAIIPYRTRLSAMFGIIKVYPELEKRRMERGYEKGPIMEIYDTENKLIVYLLPVETGVDWLAGFYLQPVLAGQPAPVTPTAAPR